MSNLLELGRFVLAQQPFSVFLGSELVDFEPGRAVLALPVRDEFRQQHGVVHGGVVSYLVDNAITFAGGSVLGENVVTVEFKVNYLRPARGERLIATAIVEGSGTRLAVCRCEVVCIEGDQEHRCAVAQGTVTLRG
ncbi:MAG: PaaI family thioesterase [Bacillota bacterium]